MPTAVTVPSTRMATPIAQQSNLDAGGPSPPRSPPGSAAATIPRPPSAFQQGMAEWEQDSEDQPNMPEQEQDWSAGQQLTYPAISQPVLATCMVDRIRPFATPHG